METMTKLIKKLTTLTEEEKREVIAEYLETLELEEIAELHKQCETKIFGRLHEGGKFHIIQEIKALCECYEF